MLLLLWAVLTACHPDDTGKGPADGDQDGVAAGEDCDDGNAMVFPGAVEVCNGIDDDCDGLLDDNADGAVQRYPDADGDGYGLDVAEPACPESPGYADVGGDCDDTTAAAHPGAPELCDGIENDCDGLVDAEDDGVEGAVEAWPDADGDGYGEGDVASVVCELVEGLSPFPGDCDGGDADVNPGADELCNGLDDDCDGKVDSDDTTLVEGTLYYRDRDGDGVGGDARHLCEGADDAGYSSVPGDCDDSDASVWSGCVEPVFAEAYDVVVVGSGAAGMAAALSAREMGASVLLVEKADTAGIGTIAGQGLMAVGTSYQAEAGIKDSPEQLVAEWEDITGVSGDRDSVRNFAEASAGVLDWLVSYGVKMDRVSQPGDTGSIARVHEVNAGAESTPYTLVGAYDGDLWLDTEVTAPVMWEDAVVGVHLTDLNTGEARTVGAHAVVMATGGPQRNPEVIEEHLPGLSARDFVYECILQATGAGLPLMDLVGAAFENEESFGVYFHAIQDPYAADGEALTWSDAGRGVIVGEDGLRFHNEDEVSSFAFYNDSPAGTVWGVVDTNAANKSVFKRPFYNTGGPPEETTIPELYGVSTDVYYADDIRTLASAIGVDPDVLSRTVSDWNKTVSDGAVDEFGRDTETDAILGPGYYAYKLMPGLAKSFGGVATDLDAAVLDEDGVAIPGLYAAGEVAGMLPGGGSGSGWGGAVAGCYYGGRTAGQEAALYAQTF